MSSTTTTPVEAPVIAPAPETTPWPDRYTDPTRVCPQQRRESVSPDVAP